MKRIIFFVLLIIPLLLILSCDKSCIKTRVKGKVTEYYTGIPVANAKVWLAEREYPESDYAETYTDDNGNYEVSLYAEKNMDYFVIAYKEMYYSPKVWINTSKKNDLDLQIYAFGFLGINSINDTSMPDNHIQRVNYENLNNMGVSYINCDSPFASEFCGEYGDAGLYNGYNLSTFKGFNTIRVSWQTSINGGYYGVWTDHSIDLWVPGHDTVYYTIVY